MDTCSLHTLSLAPSLFLSTLWVSNSTNTSTARTDTKDTSLVSTVLCPYTPLCHSATLSLRPTLYTSSFVLGVLTRTVPWPYILYSWYSSTTPVLPVQLDYSCTPCTARLLLYSLYSSTTPILLVQLDYSCTPCTARLLLYSLYSSTTPVLLVRSDHSSTPCLRTP